MYFHESQHFSQNNYSKEIKYSKERRNFDAQELKKQRITRRMKKIITSKKPFKTKENDKCAICLNQCESNSATLPCQHIFCMGCIGNWWITNSTCPYCRNHFQFIIDYKGRQLKKQQLPKDLLMKREETLKCESCWADIGDEPMRICFQCRCVYMHKRCMVNQQLTQVTWRCQQCLLNQQEQFQKIQEKKQLRGGSYLPGNRIYSFYMNQRHSQRLVPSNFEKHK